MIPGGRFAGNDEPQRRRADMRTRSLGLTSACVLALVLLAAPDEKPTPYRWKHTATEDLETRFPPPAGYQRIPVEKGSFAEWLRHLPVKPGNPPVHLYTGEKKAYQGGHLAVIDIDVGDKNLQQCADAVLRLRAEYLYGTDQKDKICFHFTSGDLACYSSWTTGLRPRVEGNRVRWAKTGAVGDSDTSFRHYLETLFTYAGTWSLRRELEVVADPATARIGDVFVEGGFPGHAVLIVDMAVNSSTGDKVIMLVQSYMPAQEIHVLRAPAGAGTGAWFRLDFGDRLKTPEWTFSGSDLRRFP